MPIEVKELVIKTTVNSRTSSTNLNLVEQRLQSFKQELLDDCMEEVKRILEENTQR